MKKSGRHLHRHEQRYVAPITRALSAVVCVLIFFFVGPSGYAQNPLVEVVPCESTSHNNSCASLNLRVKGHNGTYVKFDTAILVSVEDASPNQQSLPLPDQMLQILDREILSIVDREAVYRRAFEINGTPELSLTLKDNQLGNIIDAQIRLSRRDARRTPPNDQSKQQDLYLQYLLDHEADMAVYPLDIPATDRFKFVALATNGMYIAASTKVGSTLYTYNVHAEPNTAAQEIGRVQIKFDRAGNRAPTVNVAFLSQNGLRQQFIPHRSSGYFKDQFAFDVTLLEQVDEWRKIALPCESGFGWIRQSGGGTSLDPFSEEVVFGAVGNAFEFHDGYSFYGLDLLVETESSGEAKVRLAQLSDTEACPYAQSDIPSCQPNLEANWFPVPWRLLYTDDGRVIYSPRHF